MTDGKAPRIEPNKSKAQSPSPSFDKGTGDTGFSLSGDEESQYDLPQEVAERLVARTELRVSQTLAKYRYVKQNCKLYSLPRFSQTDVTVGPLVARGGFSNVHVIESFNKKSELNEDGNDARNFVVKHLKPKLALNTKKLVVGAKDLVMEAHIMSALNHPNVLKLRGWSLSGVASFTMTGRADGFFIVLDRLHISLPKKISQWKDEAKRKGINSFNKLNRCQDTLRLCLDRIETAVDISSAFSYLHSKGIIHRDLKPGNVGYDRKGNLKIFDFGLAVEVPSSGVEDQVYELSGNTGTARYMAPEVIRKEPYNFKADVFSFSVLLWELMALTKPYEGLSGPQVKECVSFFGDRLNIPWSWPKAIKQVVKQGWAKRLYERPSMAEANVILSKVRDDLKARQSRSITTGLFSSKRTSERHRTTAY